MGRRGRDTIQQERRVGGWEGGEEEHNTAREEGGRVGRRGGGSQYSKRGGWEGGKEGRRNTIQQEKQHQGHTETIDQHKLPSTDISNSLAVVDCQPELRGGNIL